MRCRQSSGACGSRRRLFAYLDDIWLVSKPERVGDLHSIAERELWGRARIRIHSSKTHIWNRFGRKPADCDELLRRAEMLDEEARVWTGSEIPSTQQGIKVLGCPLGHEDFVRAQWEATTAKHSALLQARPNVLDVQSAWLLLLHCASARANYQVRVLRPDAVDQFARTHDARVWQCLCNILKIPEDFVCNLHRRVATLPLSLGGLGLRSAVRTSVPAHWASWADVLPMIRDRHPAVATMIVNALEGDTTSPFLGCGQAGGAGVGRSGRF